MPHIPQGSRPNTPEELNYCITENILDYLTTRGAPNYVVFDEVLGVLEAVKLEVCRRAIVSYRTRRLLETGVYEDSMTEHIVEEREHHASKRYD